MFLSKPCSPCGPGFWGTGILLQATTVNIRRLYDWCIYPASWNILMWEGFISFFDLLHLITEIAFSEKFVNFKFVQIFSSWCFLLMVMKRLALRTCWFLDRNVIVLAIQTCYIPSWILSPVSSSLITMIGQCDRCCFVLFKEISKP